MKKVLCVKKQKEIKRSKIQQFEKTVALERKQNINNTKPKINITPSLESKKVRHSNSHKSIKTTTIKTSS